MSNPNMRPTPTKASGFNPNDIPFILARHKWKIVLCTIIGIISAGIYNSSILPDYISETKIYIRYVENGGAPTVEGNKQDVSGRNGGNIINAEIEIIRSSDLAMEVAQKVTPEKINDIGKSKLDLFLDEKFPSKEEEPTIEPDSQENIFMAAGLVSRGLNLELVRNSSVLQITYQHPNPLLSQEILDAVVKTYFKRHLATHSRDTDIGAFITEESDRFKAGLQRTDKQIQQLYKKLNFNSIEEARAWESTETARLRQAILLSKAELAELKAAVELVNNNENGINEVPQNTAPQIEVDENIILDHANLVQRLEVLKKREQELLLQYTTQSTFVRNIREQISLGERKKLDLVRANPSLATMEVAQVFGNKPGNAMDFLTAKAQAAAIQTRIDVLEDQLKEVKIEGDAVDEVQLDIEELEMKKELYVTNYKNSVESLEELRIKEAWIDNDIQGMKVIQEPTPPYADKTLSNQITAGIAASGLILGIAWAFLIELYLDRTFKRSIEVERGLGIPLFASIPNAYSRSYLRLAKTSGKESLRLTAANRSAALHAGNKDAQSSNSSLISTASAVSKQPEAESDPAPWNDSHALHPYFEALRDRMLGFFDSKNLTHSPKMIGLTGLGEATGVSTIAGGLAGALSNMGEGNVLLVDMNLGQESAHQFYQGKAVTPKEDSQEEDSSTQIEKNLFVVAEGTNGYKLPRIDPKRFNDLVTKLKNSKYDYIVFDLPAVSPISATPRLARSMDTVMLVIESEKSDKNVVEKATAILQESNQHVGAILNKTKIYGPGQLKQDFVGHS